MATEQVKTPGVGNRIHLLAVIVLSALALIAPAGARAQQPDGPARPPRARDMMRAAQDSYRSGDYEGANLFYQQAEQNKAQLDEGEKASLATQMNANNKALQGSRDGAIRVRQASDLLKEGKLQEAGTMVKAENANPYLRPVDRQLLAELNDKLKAKGGLALAGSPGGKLPALMEEPKEDYRTLVTLARAAYMRNELDASENYCKQAEKVRGMIPNWVQPWNDNDSKVLRDVQAARIKQAATAAAVREQSSKDKKDDPALAAGANKVKAMMSPAAAGQGPILTKQGTDDLGANVVAGPAVTPKDQSSKQLAPQISEETAKARQMRDQANEALKRGDLAQAKRFAEQAKAKLDPNAWWEAPSPDAILAEVARRQGGVVQASATSDPKGKPIVMPPPPGAVPADAASARLMLKEGRALFVQNRLDEADQMCTQIAAAKVRWGLFEDTPEKLRGDIKSARQKTDKAESANVLADARKLLAAGNYQEARVKAWKAKQMHGPYTILDNGDRPERLLAEIDTAEAKSKRNGTDVAAVNLPKQNGVKSKSDEPAPVPVAATNAKQRAQALLAEAQALQKANKLLEAQAKALEARAAAIEAQKAGLRFAPGEDSPDVYLNTLANLGKAKIIGLLEVTEELTSGPAPDMARLTKAANNLNEARVMAATFGLDVTPIEMKLAWVAKRLPGGLPPASYVATGVPVPPAIALDPAAGDKGTELLVQAQREIRAGRTAEARRLAEEAFNAKYGVQKQAEMVLRAIELEEFEQKRLDCDRAFIAAHDAYLRKEYKTAQGILANVDEAMLSPEKQRALREIAMSKDMQPAAGQVIQQLKGQQIDAQPGHATVTDMQPGVPGGDTAAMERYKAMAKIQFDKATKEGLAALKDAQTRAEVSDFDGAMEVLRNFNANLTDAGLQPDEVARLRRSTDSKLEQYRQRKEKQAFAKAQQDLLPDSTKKEQMRLKDRQSRDTEVVKLMDQYNQLMRDCRYEQALVVAEHVCEMDPGNLAGEAGRYQARIQAQIKRNDEIKKVNDQRFLDALDDDQGPNVSSSRPMSFDPKRWEIAGNRKNYIDGIRSEFRDPTEKYIERTLLSRKVALTLNNIPLDYAIEQLKAYCGDINIVFDNQALEVAGIRKDRPLTQSFNNISLKSALNILLSDAKLTYIIQNQAITITTEENARGKSKVVTYSVTDLVVPIENHPSPVVQLQQARMKKEIERQKQFGGYSGPAPYTGPAALPPGNNVSSPSSNQANTLGGLPPKPEGQGIEELLIRLITHTIAPDSWSDVGGKGTIQFYPLGMALVVNQTQDIQEQIVDLLQALRRLQDLEVAIEMRLVSVSEAFFERIGVDFDVNILNNNAKFAQTLTSGNFQQTGLPNVLQPGTATVGLTPAGTFTPDLGIPLKNSSFDFTVPPFGGYPGTLGADGGLSLGLAFLSDIQVFMFLEAAQGDRRTNVMQAPKITVFNGQTANIDVFDQLYFITEINANQVNGQMAFTPLQTPSFYGVSMTVTPVVSADRRFVRMNLSPQLTNLVSATVPLVPVQQIVPQLIFDNINPPQPQVFQMFFQQPASTFISLQTTVVVPDGGTVLMGGLKTLVEGRNEFGPPVLSKIPYISRLFRNVSYGREAQSLMIMVTARIIINEEEEQEFIGNLPRIPR